MQCQILKFDTKLFGFKVAKILPKKLSLTKLKPILHKLHSEKVHLVYWQADGTDKKSQQAARKLKGFLSCKQVTFLTDLKKPLNTQKSPSQVKTYRAQKPTEAMKQLAIYIGSRSRFGTDPKIPKKLMQKMYFAWIKNSVKGPAADKVLVIKHKRKVAGMITLSTKNKRGDIRLLAVATNFRGKKIGSKLVEAAKNYFTNKGFSKLQVVTQKTNIAACHLYKKCGFHQEKVDNFYHFWL